MCAGGCVTEGGTQSRVGQEEGGEGAAANGAHLRAEGVLVCSASLEWWCW